MLGMNVPRSHGCDECASLVLMVVMDAPRSYGCDECATILWL